MSTVGVATKWNGPPCQKQQTSPKGQELPSLHGQSDGEGQTKPPQLITLRTKVMRALVPRIPFRTRITRRSGWLHDL